MKLVFDYTYCSEPECWEWNIPFEYESKEKFVFDVLDNPMLLNNIGITVWEHELIDNEIYKKDYIENSGIGDSMDLVVLGANYG